MGLEEADDFLLSEHFILGYLELPIHVARDADVFPLLPGNLEIVPGFFDQGFDCLGIHVMSG